uniref:Uncharacterized protein n=1 Tax=Cacopsylla melanoneura TaxID=428564 RepID=A0A8D8RJB8_9HEMI
MDLGPDVTPSVISKLQAIQDRICGNRIHVDKKKRTPTKSVPTFRKEYVEWTSSDEEKYDVQRKSRPLRQAAAKRSIITPDSTDDSDYEPDTWYQLNESGNRIKRGRGRPKKPKLTEDKEIDESLLSLSKVLSRAELRRHNEKLESCDSDKPKIKRGRGRPRKIDECGTQTEGTSSTLSYCGSLDLEDGDFVQGIFELSEELKMEDVLKDSELSRISQEALASVYEEERNAETDATRLGLTFGDPDHYPLTSGPSTSSYSTIENSLPSTSGYQMTSRSTETLAKAFPSTSRYSLPSTSDTSSHSQKTVHNQNTPLSINIKPRPTKTLPSTATNPQKTATTPSKTPSKYSKPPPPNSHSMRTRRNLSLPNNGPKELYNEVPKLVQFAPKEVPKEIVKRPKPALPSKIYVYPPIRKINSVKLNNNSQTMVKNSEASPGKTVISLPSKTEIVTEEETSPIKMETEAIPDSKVIPKEEIEDCEITRTKEILDPRTNLLKHEAIPPEELSEKVMKTEEKSDFNVMPTNKPDRKVISTDDILSYCKSMSQEDLSDYDPPIKATNRRTSATKTMASLSVKEKMQVHPTNEKRMSKKETRTYSNEEQPRVSTQLRTKNDIKIEPRTKDIKVEMSEAYEDVLDALIERSNSEEMYDSNKKQSWKESLTEKAENRTVTSDQEDVTNVGTKVGNATNRRHSSKSNTSLDSVLTEFYGDLIATPRTNDIRTRKANEPSSILANDPVSDTGGITTHIGPCTLLKVTSFNVSTKVVDEYDSSKFPNTSITTNTRTGSLEAYTNTLPNRMENISQKGSALIKKGNKTESCFSTTSATNKSNQSSAILASGLSDSVTATHDGSKELNKTSTNSSIAHGGNIPHTLASTVTNKAVKSADNNNSSNQKCARGGYRLTSYPPLTPPPTPAKQTSQIIPRKFQVTPDKWFTCDKCGTIFKFLSTYQYHMKMDCNIKGAVQGKPPETVDGSLPPVTKGGKGAFQCPQCPKVVATRTSLMVNE